MNSDLDNFLVSPDALRQSAHLADTVLQPGESVDGLTAVALIGHGASCEVWRVRDEAKSRDLALKLFNPRDRSAAETLRERFVSEARILAAIRHPNIVRVFDSGTFRGNPYFTMELHRPLPMPPLRKREVIRIGLDLTHALEHLHSLGIVHRDLKPDNVLIASDGRAVLADLGIAALNDPKLATFIRGESAANLTIAGGHDHALGTPGYAAPEQLVGEAVTPAADYHALGVLFDTLFDHRPPCFWRPLIRSLTSSMPAFRPRSLRHIRLGLRLQQYLLPLLLVFGLVTALFITTATLTETHRGAPAFPTAAKVPRTDVVPLPAECITLDYETIDGIRTPHRRITLPKNRKYTRGDLIYPPFPHYDPQTDTTTYHRQRVTIIGPGTLIAPTIAGGEIHLVSNATIETSRTIETNQLIRLAFPNPIPTDATGRSLLLPVVITD